MKTCDLCQASSGIHDTRRICCAGRLIAGQPKRNRAWLADRAAEEHGHTKADLRAATAHWLPK